jgi:hypothetical protein
MQLAYSQAAVDGVTASRMLLVPCK